MEQSYTYKFGNICERDVDVLLLNSFALDDQFIELNQIPQRRNLVQHFKETEEGREIMCESVEKYAEKYGKECAKRQEISTKLDVARNLIKDAGFSIDQAIKVLKIGKDQQDFFVSQLQK